MNHTQRVTDNSDIQFMLKQTINCYLLWTKSYCGSDMPYYSTSYGPYYLEC